MPIFQTLTDGRVPVKIWMPDADEGSIEQLHRLSLLPILFHHAAAMPDVHRGLGATIGSVIPTKDAVIPAAVGVDIGCGMRLVKTTLAPDALDEKSLRAVYQAILKRIPVGMTQRPPESACMEAAEPFRGELAEIEGKAPGILSMMKSMRWDLQLGTLGGGNHFIEVVRDEDDGVWVLLHSGSRGAGNQMASWYIQKAKMQAAEKKLPIPEPSLAYFEADDPLFANYLEAADWAQRYASANRDMLMADTLAAIAEVFPGAQAEGEPIDCHHNYVARETHFGEEVWVTRKGAIRAGAGELGIVPGSMGAASYLVEGLGNPESFSSSAHGAGRRYGRKESFRRFTVEDLKRETEGIVCRKDGGVLDEIPSAYKDIDAVMEHQSDLARIVHRFRQVLCVKG